MSAGLSRAPPRAKLSANDKRKWDRLKADSEKVKELRAAVQASEFYDYSSPTVVDSRARARARFEEYVEEQFNVSDIEGIWNSATITDRTKEWLGALAASQTGTIEAKMKASTLWIAKQAIYWWCTRFILDFSTVFHAWHNKTSAHIHYIAVTEGLGTTFLEKNNLSDVELSLFFQHIMRQSYGVQNYKQHYVAMLLAWTTSARPGTFTVSKRYHKGARTGIEGTVREVAQTLYWKDVAFRRLEDGDIAVRVTLRYHKGYRNPHATGAHFDPSKTFTFLPTLGSRFEFDLALMLTGLAWNRGLFVGYQSLEAVLDGEEEFLRTNAEIEEQAVFVQATRAGGIDVSKPMRMDALNTKLQELCISIGLMVRYTYYSFRRTAIIETLRKSGLDAAKRLANHAPGTNSVNDSYDNEGLADTDITADRLDISETRMTSKEIRHWAGQARLRYDPAASEDFVDLRGALKARVAEAKQDDAQYVEIELALANLYQQMLFKLDHLKETGRMDVDCVVPHIYASHAGTRLREMARQYGLHTEVAELEIFLKERKIAHKGIRNRLTNDIKKQLLEEHKQILKINKTQSSRAIPGKGYQPKAATIGLERVSTDMDRRSAAVVDTVNVDWTEDDESEQDLDEETVERHETHEGGRSEPACWDGLADEITIRVDRSDGNYVEERKQQNQSVEMTHQERRNEFLVMWAMKSDCEMPNAKLQCRLCLADPTQPQKAKDTLYSQKRLNMHLRSGTHSRKSQLMRAINLELKAQERNSMLRCPICNKIPRGLVGKLSTKMMAHIEDAHPEELWNPESTTAEEDDEEEEEEQMIAGPSRRFSRPSRFVVDSDADDSDEPSSTTGYATRRRPVVHEDEDTDEDFVPEKKPPRFSGKGKAAIRD
ncbi:uncharacterized protein CC84DRAFT_1260348 [Paraphaeosphaeria sporulosa]|uniref:Uncharacterized protein n=1 Tax=Paraphaeosphaeria sporulosa TaxID=1460663 RepID=A0A177CED5_9PLEO|nr:uncharacterized protein CC84DRAFT_1260348 [Paraphaeosphaeria sporulosa]OAG05100.1 hypothetical protein CC84DRAFT_1260348 [Paraphaeosphaeria sporulosa]